MKAATSLWTTIVGGSIPREFIPACDKGFKEAIKRGPLIGFPIVGVRCLINDGQSHPVDSSELAFRTAALMGFREAYNKAKPTILEPIMLSRCSSRGIPGRGHRPAQPAPGKHSEHGEARSLCHRRGRGSPGRHVWLRH